MKETVLSENEIITLGGDKDEAGILSEISELIRRDVLRYIRKLDAQEETDEN